MRPGLDNGAFWQIVVLELQIKARMMLTNVIVYPIGHYIMKTTPSIAKIANAGLVFLDNTMGGGWLRRTSLEFIQGSQIWENASLPTSIPCGIAGAPVDTLDWPGLPRCVPALFCMPPLPPPPTIVTVEIIWIAL